MKNNNNRPPASNSAGPKGRPKKNNDLDSELKITVLPGPFAFSAALAELSVDAFHDHSSIGKMIRQMKSGNADEAADRLAKLIIRYLDDHRLPENPEVVIAIPDSVPNRSSSPVENLCRRVADHFEWPVGIDLIRRIRSEKPQKERSFEERLADTNPRYRLTDPGSVRNKRVLLFDDIYATGRSLIEAAELILEHSPKSIMALTLVKLTGQD